MQTLKDKVAVITGAGSGIGRSLAIALAKEGTKLALNDWNDQALQATISMVDSQTEVIGKAYDVSDKSSVYAFAQSVADHFGQIDIVVNNAGIAIEQRKINRTDYDYYEKVLAVNLWGVIYGTKAYLPHLEIRPEASLVNISSIFGIVGQPLQAPYVISKFGVRGFTETLRNETRNTGLAITCVHPGGIKTNIVRNIEAKHEARHDKFTKAFDKMARTTPDSAAQQIVNAIKKKKSRLLIGSDAKGMDFLARLFPSWYDKIVYRKLDLDRLAVRD